jgi:hypothetical protein
MRTAEEIEALSRSLDERLARGPIKKKRPDPPKPSAEVVPLRTDGVAKASRTRAEKITEALEKAEEAKREEANKLYLEERRNQAYINSVEYIRAGERFNQEYHQPRDQFNPNLPHGFWK